MIRRGCVILFACAFASALQAGEWVRSTMTNASGARAFEVYVPDESGSAKLPLLVAIHGCTQTPADFAGLARVARLADEENVVVLMPAQSALANPSLCWNWFLEGNQKRGEGEPALIVAMIDWVKKRHRIDESRVYVMGVSSGGYMTSILLSCYSDVFAAGAVASGGMYRGATDVWSAVETAGHGSTVDPKVAAEAAYRCSGSAHPRAMPVLVFDGSDDPYVASANGEQVVAQFVQLNDLGDDGLDNDSISLEQVATEHEVSAGGLEFTRSSYGPAGLVQHCIVEGMGHAWAGGDPQFAYAEPRGPDETRIVWSFLEQYRRGPRAKRRAAGN